MKEEHRHMLEKGFEVVAEHVKEIVNDHKVLPSEISIPYCENGRWIRLTLGISPVRDEDPDKEQLYNANTENPTDNQTARND